VRRGVRIRERELGERLPADGSRREQRCIKTQGKRNSDC
jgi:hypothetical protein